MWNDETFGRHNLGSNSILHNSRILHFGFKIGCFDDSIHIGGYSLITVPECFNGC